MGAARNEASMGMVFRNRTFPHPRLPRMMLSMVAKSYYTAPSRLVGGEGTAALQRGWGWYVCFRPSASQRNPQDTGRSQWTPGGSSQYRRSVGHSGYSQPQLTCNMANLCISPVHAGIISFRTPNSSFIFDLLRRSIRLCAVFLAILRPATLVEDGCFFFAGDAFPAPLFLGPSAAGVSACSSGCALGFIWMIFRDRVGGGGKAKESLLGVCATEDRRRILTTSLGGRTGDLGDDGWYEEPVESLVEAVEGRDSPPPATAGGGSSKDIWREENCEPSLPLISVEEAGVGRCSTRGILAAERALRFKLVSCATCALAPPSMYVYIYEYIAR